MKTLSPPAFIATVALSGFSCSPAVHAAEPNPYTRLEEGPRRLRELQTASAEELAAVLSRECEGLFFASTNVIGYTARNSWEVAIQCLGAKLEEGRPHLFRMLDSPDKFTVLNALHVLSKDKSENLAPVTAKLLSHLRHDSPEVQLAAAKVVGNFRDERAETALLAIFKLATGPKPGYDRDLAVMAMEGLTKNAFNREKVVAALLPLLRSKGTDSWLLRAILHSSRSLTRGGAESTALVTACCQVFTSTKNGYVRWEAMETLASGDARSVNLLRGAALAKNQEVRAFATRALLGHKDFSPLNEQKFTRSLLKSGSYEVRDAAMEALCDRDSAKERLLAIQAAADEISTNRDPWKKVEALECIFRARCRSFEAEELEQLVRQPGVALPQKMVTWLDDRSLSDIIVRHSAYQAGDKDRKMPADEQLEMVRAWWRSQVPGKMK